MVIMWQQTRDATCIIIETALALARPCALLMSSLLSLLVSPFDLSLTPYVSPQPLSHFSLPSASLSLLTPHALSLTPHSPRPLSHSSCPLSHSSCPLSHSLLTPLGLSHSSCLPSPSLRYQVSSKLHETRHQSAHGDAPDSQTKRDEERCKSTDVCY
jgi:hypothetical protein